MGRLSFFPVCRGRAAGAAGARPFLAGPAWAARFSGASVAWGVSV